MSISNPLQSVHESAGASFMPYGDARVVETFGGGGALEAEYAALRKGAGLFDMPHRGTIEVAGADRLEFLNRMITQELKAFEPFTVRRSFWLNRKGRIDADMRLVALPDRILVDVEVLSVQRTIEGLSAYLFAEDVQIVDRTDAMHRLALHGPRAREVLEHALAHTRGASMSTMEPDQVGEFALGEAGVIVDRFDSAGEAGFELLVRTSDAERIFRALAEAPGVRPIGWHAYNIARLEAGTPIFGIDFGATSLPHEAGPSVLNDRVSFRKGCYLGQEIVARMQSLGHPKQVLRAMRVTPDAGVDPTDQPGTGSPLVLGEKVVGAVTSCTRSPMLGDAIVALAQVKWDASTPGTELRVEFAGGGSGVGVIRDELEFWRHAEARAGTPR